MLAGRALGKSWSVRVGRHSLLVAWSRLWERCAVPSTGGGSATNMCIQQAQGTLMLPVHKRTAHHTTEAHIRPQPL